MHVDRGSEPTEKNESETETEAEQGRETKDAVPEVAPSDPAMEQWFDAPTSARRSSIPPSAPQTVGEFLGDPLADAWLR